jgi:nitrogen fixation/metabolism regulation signal transduction histidine kinase
MGFKRFSILIAIRIVLIMISIAGLLTLVVQTGYIAAPMLVGGLLVYQCFEVFNFVAKTNRELARFLDAARYADYSQRFELSGLGAGFDELGQVLTGILKRFHEVRATQEKELKYMRAMVEHVPVPLLTIHDDEKVVLLNNSARRLFGSHQITKLSDMEPFGGDLTGHLVQINPGERRLVNLDIDGMAQQLSISSTQVIIGQQNEKLVSLLDIQGELDRAQLNAWQDLVRVLTHEIMNSITPVASLAKTASDLVADAREKISNQPELEEELDDVASAVGTVARRSDGLMKFVASYRQLTRLPPPKKHTVKVKNILDNAISVAAYNWQENGLVLKTSVTPTELTVSVDKEMIEQVLINLLKNAEQALDGTADKRVGMHAKLNKRGHVVIEIEDNGPGIEAGMAQKVFVPFFTTKREGSGVGLALTRQVMIAHGGNVRLDPAHQPGCRFVLTF